MGYWNRPTGNSLAQLDSNRRAVTLNDGGGGNGDSGEFFEIEPAVVLDIILDANHSYLKKKPQTLNPEQVSPSVDNKPALPTDPDLSWVGRAKVRLLYNQRLVEKEDCAWAIPLETNISEYPLLNEVVGVVCHLGQYYYTRKINQFNLPNSNADFNLELLNGGAKTTGGKTQGNREFVFTEKDAVKPYQGPTSKTNLAGGVGYQGVLGRYFVINPRIRSVKRHEGDMVLESRFGQSIRFSAYDNNRDNDVGIDQDYKIGNGVSSFISSDIDIGKGGTKVGDMKKYPIGGGNPMIIIRNRQRPIAGLGKPVKPYTKVPGIVGTTEEKNIGGYIEEDVNNDGTSIHITSGLTVSNFVTNCSKAMWGKGSEEQVAFNGTTAFKYPTLMGDQIVINSDRIILSAKKGEIFNFAKKRYAIVTDDEFTVDAHNQIVFTSNNKTVINSPAIYLGEYDETGEPVLLGQTTVNWLFEFCNLFLEHTHWYKHVHPDAQGGTVGQPNPNKTQTTVQWAKIRALRDNLQACLSRRVFVVGGGYAPGSDGENLK